MTKEDLKIFQKMPTLYTERLILRKININDLDDIYEYASDASVSKYLLWNPHPNKYYTNQYLKLILSKYKKCEFFDWGIEYKEKMIGTCGFTLFDLENNSAEIGYVLNSNYWHRGIAAEASKKVLNFGFNVLKLNRIEAKYMSENIESRKVSEKIGMEFEGEHKKAIYAKNRYIDVSVSAITADKYFNIDI